MLAAMAVLAIQDLNLTMPGSGKHIVLLAGDEEYRSEEGLPQLARILSRHHGFRCTVVFSLNASGEIDPNVQDHQPGIAALESADVVIMLLRFRRWPDSQMRYFAEYFRAGKPIIALRTSTHAFAYPLSSPSDYRHYDWQSASWPGGFGKQVLGETWVSHWGNHGSQATRGVAEPSARSNALLNGVAGVFGTTDVYEAAPPADATILLRGEVVAGMGASDPPASGKKKTASGNEQEINSPMMPIAWSRLVKNDSGRTNRVLTVTMGAATDFLNEGLRRLIVNGVFWSLGREVPPSADVALVGEYQPSSFGFGGHRRGLKPSDLASGI